MSTAKYEDQIKDLIYYQWLLITGGARGDYCKDNIDRIMWSVPTNDWEPVQYEVSRRVGSL